MLGENGQYGVPSSKNDAKENRHDFLKSEALKRPVIIDGAVGVLINDANLHGKPMAEVSATDVLKYLFPTSEQMWRDEELLIAAGNALREKAKEMGDVEFEDIQAGAILTRRENTDPLSANKKMMRGAYGHEMRNKTDD